MLRAHPDYTTARRQLADRHDVASTPCVNKPPGVSLRTGTLLRAHPDYTTARRQPADRHNVASMVRGLTPGGFLIRPPFMTLPAPSLPALTG